MGHLAHIIKGGTGTAMYLGERLLDGVTPERFARLPAPGGKAIQTNHPAFAYGHLSIYPVKILSALGLDPSAAAPPEGFPEVFDAGKQCVDDPDGTIYPPMDRVTAHFFAAHRALMNAVADVSDEKLAAPNPPEGFLHETFATIGGLTCFTVMAHTMLHLGQVSAWRRAEGLPAAM